MITDLPLHYLLSTPSRKGDHEPLPMFVLMHGRGADAQDLAELAPILDASDGYRFVFPQAPKPFEPYPGTPFGWTWFEGWPPEHDSVVESRKLLLRFLDAVTARYPTSGLIIGGFSQGAMMALDSGLRRSESPTAIVALSGGLYEEDLGDAVRNARMPVFLGHGLSDDVVPIQYARRARRVLEDAGVDVTYREYPMAHQIVMEEMEDVRQFLSF